MNSYVKVNIREIAVGGAGVGEVVEGPSELLGITAFVPFTARGEVVRAKVTKKKERFINAELEVVERSSELRAEPLCAWYGECGGCDLQHISYAEQLEAKQAMIEGALKAQRLKEADLACVRDIIPSSPYAYRRRVTLHVSSSGEIGFYRAKTRSLVAIDHCSIANQQINNCLSQIQDFAKELAGKISSIILDSDDAGVVAVLRAPSELTEAEVKKIESAAREVFSDLTILSGKKEQGGYGRKILDIGVTKFSSKKISVPAGEFSQVNAEVNIELVAWVLGKGQVGAGQTVDDLYAGAGNFSIPLAKQGAKVVAVECAERLSMFCSQNSQRFLVQTQVVCESVSVEKFLKQQEGSGREVDLIIADPPRSGLNLLAKKLNYSRRLILISCQLPAFARDLKILNGEGWQVAEIQAFDMFAQTSHLEIAALFLRE